MERFVGIIGIIIILLITFLMSDNRKKIFIKGEAIKEVGKYNATVNVYKDIKAEFAFDVIAE